MKSLKEQANDIYNHEKKGEKLKNGETYYLCNMKWWKKWVECTKYSDNVNNDNNDKNDTLKDWEMVNKDGNWTCKDPDIGRIENQELLILNNGDPHYNYSILSLKLNLYENIHFKLLAENTWNELVQWYGFDISIPRNVISRHNQLCVDLYPIVFQLMYWNNNVSEPRHFYTNNDSKIIQCLSFHSTEQIIEILNSVKKYIIGCSSEETNLHIPSSDLNAIQICYRRFNNEKWIKISFDDYKINNETIDFLSLEDNNKHDYPYLLVEIKDKNTNMFPSDKLANQWRYDLKIGDFIDALDSAGKWYESRIIGATESIIRIHYLGWTNKWDIDIDRMSPNISPLYTKVPQWRNFKIGDIVEVGKKELTSIVPKWYEGKIDTVDEAKNRVLIEIKNIPNGGQGPPKEWMDISDELICRKGTHIDSSPTTSSFNIISSSNSNARTNHFKGAPPITGAVGLQNLGNTCFMNSMLQCLSNSKKMTHYFLTQKYLSEINYDNPLGMGGKIAKAYANLLNDMWSGNFTVCVPNQLKSVIGQYAPQFAGYQQQDSQELMSFLLDGLHEDLNRIKNKPYTELVESNGRPDYVVAKEAWEQYQRRNQSIIVDECMGLLKSHVTCPECGYESITFDPYMSLSVPLPLVSTRQFELKLFWSNGEVPTRFLVSVDKTGTIIDLKESLSLLCKIESSKLLILDVYSHRVSRVFSNSAFLQDVQKKELDVYELEMPLSCHILSSSLLSPTSIDGNNDRSVGTSSCLASENNEHKKMRLVNVLHQAPSQLSDDDSSSVDGSILKHRRVALFGTPLVLSFSAESTNNEIHRRMWFVVRRLLKPHTKFSDKLPPYNIVLTNPSGTIFYKDKLEHNDDIFQSPDTQFSFLLEWSSAGYKDGYHEGEAEKVNMHESINSLNMSTSINKLSLKNCILKFTEREQLGENDPWYCSKCKTHQRAYKKFDLWSVPNILIIHLKRFRYNQGTYLMHRDKIDSVVDFPINGLDMSDYVVDPSLNENENCKSGKMLYDLFAVSEHSGGLGGGHYTSIAKNFNDNEWYNFNDSFVSKTSPENAVSSQSYVLFYARRE